MLGLAFLGSSSSRSPVTFSHGTNIRLSSLAGVTTVEAGGGGGGGGEMPLRRMGWEGAKMGIWGHTAEVRREDRGCSLVGRGRDGRRGRARCDSHVRLWAAGARCALSQSPPRVPLAPCSGCRPRGAAWGPSLPSSCEAGAQVRGASERRGQGYCAVR